MNRLLRYFLISISFLVSGITYSQNGTIRGTVIDDATGETLFGVTVVIKGTTNGAATDFEGAFTIKAEPGIYDIQASFISFETVTVSNVEVKAGEVTAVGTIRLGESVEQLEEVVITAEAIKTTETALLTVKKKSANLIDGISSEAFSRVGDSDAAGAIKRVPGVSIQGGQYVFVRGLGDRYTKTVLNGLEVPGLDPDRNAIQIDIFPTNLVDNIVVYKTFTPELSADFSGGVVNIETKDFPDEKTTSFSASFEYNPEMHFQGDYLNYDRSGTDFLGFDNGSRDLPFRSTADNRIEVLSSGSDFAALRGITQRFERQLATERQTSFANFGFSFSTGNQIDAGSKKIGYIAGVNYSNKTRFFDTAIDAANLRQEDFAANQIEPNVIFNGPLAENDVQLSGLLGGALKTNNSKYSLKVLHIQNGISRAADRLREEFIENPTINFTDNLEYTERFLTNISLLSEQYFEGIDAELSVKGAATFSTLNDKDVRSTFFTQDEQTFELLIDRGRGQLPRRIWRLLDEQNYVAKIDFLKNFEFQGNESKFKAGLSNVYKERDFEIQNFEIETRRATGIDFQGDPDQLLAPENIITADDGFGTAIQDQLFDITNAYSGRINIFGAYVSGEIGLTERLKTILGVRLEQYDQFYTGINQAGLSGDSSGIFNDDNVLSSLDFFPSVNFIYATNDNSNLRASYSRTIARPSFKELSLTEIVDVLTGRTFIGNIDLVETDIDNFDLRWEYFFKRGQTVSIGGFYKRFQNPIELVRQPTQPNDFRPTNVGDGRIIGGELEIRKNLDFISPFFEKFLISTNLTYTDAIIEIDSAELQGRETGARVGETVSDERPFLGQPEFVVNFSLIYDDFDNGLQLNLSFNRQSETLAVVGINRSPDTFDVPFNSLNFNASKTFGDDDKNKIGFKVTNILDDNRERIQSAFGSRSLIETFRDPGVAFQVKYSRNF